jgi:outer membrane lipoprotein-sorting protein
VIEYSKIDLAPGWPTTRSPSRCRKERPRRRPSCREGVADTDALKQAKKLLIETHNAFAGTDALTYVTEMISEVTGEDPAPPQKTVTTLKRPDFIRQANRSDAWEYIHLADGEFMWNVMPDGKNFTKRELTTAAHRLLSGIDPLIHVFFEGERPETLSNVQDVSVSQDKLDGETCEMIEWSVRQPDYKMKVRYWLDSGKRPRLKTIESDLKGKKYKMTVKYLSYDLKPAIPKDHFTFKPGPEWTDRSEEQLGEKLIAAGKQAPDFEVCDPDDKAVKLSSFRGSTVLIVFGYFRNPAELQRVKEFQEEFAKRGVTVLAVSVVAELPKTDPKKQSFRILRLKDKAVVRPTRRTINPGAMYLLDGELKVLAASYSNDVIRKAVNEIRNPPNDDPPACGPPVRTGSDRGAPPRPREARGRGSRGARNGVEELLAIGIPALPGLEKRFTDLPRAGPRPHQGGPRASRRWPSRGVSPPCVSSPCREGGAPAGRACGHQSEVRGDRRVRGRRRGPARDP